MNLLTKQKETHTLKMNFWVLVVRWGKDAGERIVRKFGMDMYTLLYLKWITNKDLHGALLNVMWQPEWEGSLGENGYMDVYDQVLLLFTWNYHNIVNQLYSNTKYKVFKKEQIPWRKDFKKCINKKINKYISNDNTASYNKETQEYSGSNIIEMYILPTW